MLDILFSALWSGSSRIMRWAYRNQVQAAIVCVLVSLGTWAWFHEWRPAWWVTSNRGRVIVHLWPADAARLRSSPGVHSVEPVTNRREARR